MTPAQDEQPCDDRPDHPADQLSAELVQAAETPAVILLRWPAAPSVTDVRKCAAIARAVTGILAEARTALARHQADEM